MPNRNILINFLKIIFYFSPLSIISGPFLADLSISIMAIIFLFIAINEKLKKYFFNNYSYFFIFFIIYFIVSSLFSEFISLSLEASFLYFRFFLFSLCVWFLLDQDRNILKNFSIIFIFTLIFVILNGYFQYYFGFNFFGIVSSSESRLTLLLSEKLYLGGYIVRLLPLCFGLLIYYFSNTKNKKLYLSLFLFLFIGSDLLVFITGERTAFILLLMLTILFISLVSSLRFIRIMCFIFSLILITLITLYSTQIKERNIDHTLRQLAITTDNFSPRHVPIYLASIEIFYDNFLLGIGPKTYREVCKKEKYNKDRFTCSTHSHNSYLQLLSETGIIGVLFLIIPFLYINYRIINFSINLFIYKKRNLTDFEICILICFFITLWPIQPSMSFFNNWINTIYYFPLGFYLHSIYNRKS